MPTGIERVYRVVTAVYTGAIALNFIAMMIFFFVMPPVCIFGAGTPAWEKAVCMPGGYATLFLGLTLFAVLCTYMCRCIVAAILVSSDQKKRV
jgi:hypothetical protein